MKKILILLLLLGAAGTAFAFFGWKRGETARSYRFVEIERGDLEATVDATGNLSAVSTVAVGTQVSGRILGIFADFNGRVKAGQLIAQLDPVLLEQTVREVEASLARRRADLERLERDFARSQQLYADQLLSESDFNAVQFNLAAAKADVASAQASLDRARQNLAYTEIYSPIDGVVIERNVDVGQTVAASLSAPQLFLIAEDLSKMQIKVAVDESDIGKISEGQTVRFTVQAYPDDAFYGTVEQVRLQSAVKENVVTYTVVVAVRNSDGRLLPGMTATADFLVETAKDVLKVPNAALRFRPTAEMIAELRAQREGAGEADAARPAGRAGGAPGARIGGGARQRSARALRIPTRTTRRTLSQPRSTWRAARVSTTRPLGMLLVRWDLDPLLPLRRATAPPPPTPRATQTPNTGLTKCRISAPSFAST
ncbi:MAG: efflux RND transporter periplasmic adaptor subunit [Thermoanaerobaculia bacterium]|nr:efflux RND transporter periplasmic adaptor subunit [Thermoanaerobaculia bacterium]